MELLLNLCWLGLALPAYWLWRRERASGSASRHHPLLSPVLVLGCMLVLLFPVVSATDDLHAMRPEIEESNPSKHIARQADGGPSSAISAIGHSPAWLSPIALWSAEPQAMAFLPDRSSVVGDDAGNQMDSGRAPPSA